MNLEAEILKGLADKFRFKRTGGTWLQEGQCPDCNQWEVYCAAKEPKVVRCGRSENCGSEWSVRALLPDLFENWSKRFTATDQNPNAAADAYLLHERGLDLQYLRGAYTQELYREGNHTSATVRFPVGDTWWERLIDQPGRFGKGKKAHFQKGGKPGGHCWIPPRIGWDRLASADDIWITEGIFNAAALAQGADITAVSAMSSGFWPEHFLDRLRTELQAIKRPTRPRLVFAFDPGAAGVKSARKFVAMAKDQGWEATAAQVSPDGEGTELDWNDLLLRHQQWRGDAEKAPLGPEALAEYLYNGAVTIAATPRIKAKLIYEKTKFATFDFRHGNRLWWCKVSYDEENEQRNLLVDEICTCAFRVLYMERDDIEDETNFFIQLDFPDRRTVKARFSNNALAKNGEFETRMLAFAGLWLGNQEQLNRIKKRQLRKLKQITPVRATGYSEPHRAWLFGDIAVRDGRLERLNSDKYFDFGKDAVKLYSEERMLAIDYNSERLDFDWLPDLWTAYGPKGLVILAFFTMSLFAVQIRRRDGSLGFLEITGVPGSGKTTAVVLFWKMLGRANYEGHNPNAASLAALTRIMMKVSNLPVGIIEGKRDDDRRGARAYDYNDLLTLYNGRNPRATARKTGGFETSEPPFLGSIYLMQNERIDAMPAVLERLMSIDIDKSRFSDAAREAATRLKRWPTERLSGTIVHVVRNEAKYLPFFFEREDFHLKEMGRRVDGLTNDRCILNHSQLAAAVESLPHLFGRDVRPEWIAETLALVDAMALDRQTSSGGDHPVIAKFWDQVEHLIDAEKADAHGKGELLNQHRKPDQKIAIRLTEFEARARHAGLTPPDGDVLRKLLRNSHSRKFLRYDNVNNPLNKSVKCWVFAQPQKAERII